MSNEDILFLEERIDKSISSRKKSKETEMISMNRSLYLSVYNCTPLGLVSVLLSWRSLSIWVVTDQCKWVANIRRVFILICLETIIGFHLWYESHFESFKTVVSIWCLFPKYSIRLNRLLMLDGIVYRTTGFWLVSFSIRLQIVSFCIWR